MTTAWITLRHQPPYRSGAFANGFENLGYTPRLQFPEPGAVRAGDVVVTWNMNVRYRGAAEQAKTAGAALIVAENGYIHRNAATEPYYALARDGHNGSGNWWVGAEDRWALLNHTLRPWQGTNRTGYILIADQRSIGSELMKSPRQFQTMSEKRIKSIFARAGERSVPVRYRPHPGRNAPKETLSDALRGARAVVTWSSNVANIATLMGVPSFRMAPYHVNSAVLDDMNLLPNPPEPDRVEGFRRLAWAQWAQSEIEAGTAFEWLLQDIA